MEPQRAHLERQHPGASGDLGGLPGGNGPRPAAPREAVGRRSSLASCRPWPSPCVVAGCAVVGRLRRRRRRPSASAPDRDRIVSYEERLDLVEALGARYRGKGRAGCDPGRGRPVGQDLRPEPLAEGFRSRGGPALEPAERLPHRRAVDLRSRAAGGCAWRRRRSALRIERVRPTHPTPAVPGPSIDRTGQCEAWMRYFLGSRQGLPATTLQSLIWDAHTASLMHAARVDRRGARPHPVPARRSSTTSGRAGSRSRSCSTRSTLPTSGAETLPVARDLMPVLAARSARMPAHVADLGPSFRSSPPSRSDRLAGPGVRALRAPRPRPRRRRAHGGDRSLARAGSRRDLATAGLRCRGVLRARGNAVNAGPPDRRVIPGPRSAGRPREHPRSRTSRRGRERVPRASSRW